MEEAPPDITSGKDPPRNHADTVAAATSACLASREVAALVRFRYFSDPQVQADRERALLSDIRTRVPAVSISIVRDPGAPHDGTCVAAQFMAERHIAAEYVADIEIWNASGATLHVAMEVLRMHPLGHAEVLTVADRGVLLMPPHPIGVAAAQLR